MMIKDTPVLSEFTVKDYSITQEELKTYDVQKTYIIQEGAAQGKSICIFQFSYKWLIFSQNDSRRTEEE